MFGIIQIHNLCLVQNEQAAGEIGGPAAAGFGKLAAEHFQRLVRQRLQRNLKGKWLMLIQQVEREDPHGAIGASCSARAAARSKVDSATNDPV